MAIEIGKPIADARLEVDFALALIRAAALRAADAFATPDGKPTPYGIERRRALGTVALVTPWNVPLAIPLGKIVPALLYGNAVVWKPAPAGWTRSRMSCRYSPVRLPSRPRRPPRLSSTRRWRRWLPSIRTACRRGRRRK